jgi:hypothetical protein
MTDRRDRAIAEVRAFPPDMQDVIAARTVEERADEQEWEAQFAAASGRDH